MRAAKLDGWLFYDFRGRDPIAQRILKLPPSMRTRRWFYFVPAKGTPRKLVHKIETESLATMPGETLYYAGLDELKTNLAKTLGRAKNVAMQYSPKNQIPYVSMVDAGTIEMVRGAGVKVVSSADLVQKYEACWTPDQLKSHLAAGAIVDRVVQGAFQQAAKHVREKRALTEYDLQQWIRREFDGAGIVKEPGPDVAVNAQRQRSALRASAGSVLADSRRRSAVAGCLGQTRSGWERLLRHDLDGLSRREGAREVRENFFDRARCARQGRSI